MLSNEIMGVLALGVLWVNTVLIAAVALKRFAALARRRSAMVPRPGSGGSGEGLFSGVVESEGAIAEVVVEQLGRALGEDRDAIVFSDRSYASRVVGGAVRAGDAVLKVPGGVERGEAWVGAEEMRGAAACPSDEAFGAGLKEASRTKGWPRAVRALISRGDRVWVYGTLSGDGVIAPGREGLLVSKIDPRAWLLRSMGVLVGFALACVLGAGICTFLALQEPLFGPVSTFGGALSLAFFLLVQPAGTAVRDFVREPSRSIIRGEWRARRNRAVGMDPARSSATNAGDMERG